MEADKTTPIAIIGMNLKFPGDAVSAQAFWELVMSARNVSKEIPADRFNIDGMSSLSEGVAQVTPANFGRQLSTIPTRTV